MAFATVLCGTQSWAQDPSEAAASDVEAASQDNIIVTGSRIPRAGFETLQPALVLDNQQIQDRAIVNVADALNEVAAFGVPGNAPVNQQNGQNVGQNFVNFLGLGSRRTLTLVNGLRFPAGNSPAAGGAAPGLQVDLNSIPTALVDRIETIAVGGAPIYGTDAIAGTVNIILKDDFEGLELIGQYGLSMSEGDNERYRVGLTWGTNFDDGRGNLVLSGEHSSLNGLLQTDRGVTARQTTFESPDPALMSPFNQILVDDIRVAATTLTGIPLPSNAQFFFAVFGNTFALDPTDPTSPAAQFDGDGNLIPFVPGGGTGSLIFVSGGDGLNLAELTSLASDVDRYNANIFVNYDLTNNIRVKAEGWFSRTESSDLVNQPDFNGVAFAQGIDTYEQFNTGAIPVLISNPFLPTATRDIIDMQIPVGLNIDTDGDGVPDERGFYVDRGDQNIFLGSPNSATRDLFRGVLGFEGETELGDRTINWDVTYSYGRVESKTRTIARLARQFEQATRAIFDPGGSGEIVCEDPTGGCVPINPFGMTSPEGAAFVTAINRSLTVSQQHFLTANATSRLFTLPAGDVDVAGGFDFRIEKSAFMPSEIAANGFLNEREVPVSGRFSTKEIYGEAVIPVLGGDLDTPLVDFLEFEGALRFVDNSIAGSDLTWTAGGRYQPFQGLQFRGNVTRSIRAPAIEELFQPSAVLFAFANDPCDSRFITQGNFPTRRAANCAADGIAQPFLSAIVNASQRITQSGNPDLGNEKAKSWTAGVILQPSFIPGLTVASDWIDILIQDAIESLDPTTILQSCYDSEDFPGGSGSPCALFTRDGAGQIASLQSGFANIGSVQFKGLLTDLSYGFDIGDYGNIDLRVNHIYLNDLTSTVGAGNPNQNAGEIGNSKHRVTTNVSWSKDRYRVFSQVQWASSAVFNNADDAFSRDVSGVGEWWLVNMGTSYNVSDDVQVQFNVDNVFNVEPPFPGLAGCIGGNNCPGVSTYISGVLGRYVTFTVRGSF